MHFTKQHWILIAVNVCFLVPFTLYYIAIKNFEFLWYVLVLLLFVVLIVATIHRSNFPLGMLWGLSLWGFLHMAGGGIRVAGDVLYALPLVPLAHVGDTMIVKYDQVVHAFGFFMATLVVFHLLKPYLSPQTNWRVVIPICIVAGMGLGALNEMVEFAAVLVAKETGVGGYYNTALDLVFNALGAALAGVWIAKKNGNTIQK